MKTVLVMSCVVLLISLMPSLLSKIMAPSFTVHKNGGIIISGASTGIGKHAAEYLAAHGAFSCECLNEHNCRFSSICRSAEGFFFFFFFFCVIIFNFILFYLILFSYLFIYLFCLIYL